MLIGRDMAQRLDPVLFAEACADPNADPTKDFVTPDPWQRDFLRSASRRSLLLCSRQSGKSLVTAIKSLHTALYQPGSLTIIVSPALRQSSEMVRTIKLLHSRLDNAPGMPSDSVLKVEFENNSRILALPGTGDTIRGLSAVALVVIDEASRVPDELLAVLRPMVATSKGTIVALTTPKGKRGFFYDAWHSGDPTWHRVRVSADQCPRISKEFLAEELRELGPTQFAEEYNLAFVDDLTAAFSTALIDGIVDHNLKALWT